MRSDGFEDDDFIDDGDVIVIYYRTAFYVHVCESMAQFINMFINNSSSGPIRGRRFLKQV